MDKREEIKKAVDAAAQELSGPLGVGFYDLKNGEEYYHNGDMLFPTASIFKIFVLAELYRKVFNGEVSLNDKYELKDEMKSLGSGIMYQMSKGTAYSLYDYALLMMIISDNTAADFLYEFVGRDNIYENVIAPLGLKNTKVDFTCADLFTYYFNTDPNSSDAEKMAVFNTSSFLNNEYYKCNQEKNDETTPEDLSIIFKTIYNGQWCDKKTSLDMQDLMKKCQTNSRIPKYFPRGVQVAHKTGTFDRLVNDSGIVYTDKGDFILTLLYNGNLADEKEYILNHQGFYGEEVIAKLARKIYDIYVR